MNSEDEKLKQQKAGNPLFIIIIFVVLIGFLFYIPEIYKKYNSEIMKFLGGDKDTEEKGNDSNSDKSPISAYYQLGSKSTLKFNEIELSDILLTGKTLTFKLNTEDMVDLDELEYYVEFYQDRTKFLGRRVLHGKVTRQLTISLDLSNLPVTTTTYMTVSHISEGTIKPLEAESDESGLSVITCSKDSKNYEYEFYLKKLTKTTYKYDYHGSSFDEFAAALLEMQKTEKTYNEYNGVTARIIENNNSFIFLSEFDYSKVSSFQKLGDPRIFDKGTFNSVVKFKMDAEGYDCQ